MKRRFGLTGFILILASCLFYSSVFAPVHQVSAQATAPTEEQARNATARWINRSYVEVTAGPTKFLFHDEDIADNNFQYLIQNYPCNGGNAGDFELEFNNAGNAIDPSHGDLDLDIIPAGAVGTNCVDLGEGVTKTIADAAKSNIIYSYVDADTIARVDGDGSWVFNRSPQYPNLYLRTSEAGQACQDVIVVPLGPVGIDTFTLYELTTDSSSGDEAPEEAHSPNCFDAGNTRTSSGVTPGLRGQTLGSIADVAGTPLAGGGGPGGGPGGTGGDQNATCEARSLLSINWILCPIFNGLADLTDWLFRNLIQPLLTTEPISTSPEDGTFQIWSGFRVYANIFLIVAMLVIVFAQAIGGGLVDAYTVKKSLPRVFVAVILINLSLYIVALAVDVTNVIGGAIGQLMIAPIRDSAQFTFSPSGIQSAGAFAVGGAAAGAVVGPLLVAAAFTSVGSVAGSALGFILLFVLLPAVLALIAAFVTLIIRKGIIVALVIVSPIAFALYALPNTEQYFRKWWSFLIKTLMVYPIVVIIFAVADILTVTIMQANNLNGPLLSASGTAQAAGSGLAYLVAFGIQFITLGFIPFAFKVAGGAAATVFGALTGTGGKLGEFIKGNPNDPNSLRNKSRKGLASRYIGAGTSSMSAMRKQTLEDSSRKFDPTTRRGRAANRVARRAALMGMGALNLTGDLDRRRMEQNELFDKEISNKVNNGADYMERAFFAKQWTGNDQEVRNENGDVVQTLRQGRWYSTYRSPDGKYSEHSAGDVGKAHNMYDGNESKIQTLTKYELGKINNDQDLYGIDANGNTLYDPSQADNVDRSRLPMGSFLSNLPTTMRDSGLDLTSATGASIGTFFGTQSARKELKHTKLTQRGDGSWGWKQDPAAFVQDFAENVGSYPTASGKTSPVKRLTDIHQTLTAAEKVRPLTFAERRTKDDLVKIARSLDSRLRAGAGAVIEEGTTPIPGPAPGVAGRGVVAGGPSGGAGRVDDAIREFVNNVNPNQVISDMPGEQRNDLHGGPPRSTTPTPPRI